MSSFSDKTFAGVGNLIKLLPTGTIFIYQFPTPIITGKNSGECSAANRAMKSAIIALCGLSCFFASLTDSYFSGDGKRRYGVVTFSGLWTGSGAALPDLSEYRLRIGDFVHAILSLVVFMAVALLDWNTVRCLCPSFVGDLKLLVQVLPAVIGAFSCVVFVLFPNERHGIGYPLTSDDITSARNRYPTGKV